MPVVSRRQSSLRPNTISTTAAPSEGALNAEQLKADILQTVRGMIHESSSATTASDPDARAAADDAAYKRDQELHASLVTHSEEFQAQINRRIDALEQAIAALSSSSSAKTTKKSAAAAKKEALVVS